MSDVRYLIFHKDHPLHVTGVNSGAENATLWLARALVNSGCEVVVCGQLPEGEAEHWGVKFWDLGPNFDVSSALKRARNWGSYHLISACRAVPIIASLDESMVLSRHFIAHDPSSGAAGIQPKILSRIVDSMICVSEAQKGLFVQAGADAKKVHVIANGADTTLFKPGDPAQRNYKNFVFVGALVSHKGIDILLNAFLECLSQHPDASLDIFGSSSMWGQSPVFDEKEIGRRFPQIIFHGAVQQIEVAKAFAKAGVCIIPSRWFDSFPLTAVEAQASGCPVIAFDVGGIREAVQNEVTGKLLPEVSETALHQELMSHLQSPEKLKKWSANALETVRPKFTWDNVAKSVRNLCENNQQKREFSEAPVAILTTWNQECGLATYARYMTAAFDAGSYLVFGEETDAKITADESFVERCWKRSTADFSKIEAAIKKHSVKVLHLNCHYRFFPQPEISTFLSRIRAEGVKVVALIHNLFTFDDQLRALVQSVDSVLVHSAENRLEAIANGADPKIVSIIPHGVETRMPLSNQEKLELRKELGISTEEKIAVTFGFVQPHKGIEGLIEGIAHLARRGISCTGVVAGKPNDDDPYSKEYQEKLKAFAKEAGVEKKIIFLDRFLSEVEVAKYLGVADLVLLNYRSQHYEASGACSLAVGAGAAVVTSIAPPFLPFHDAVFHATAGYPIPLAFEAILTNETLRTELLERVRSYNEHFSWKVIKEKLFGVYRTLGCVPSTQKEPEVKMKQSEQKKKLKVLLHNRPTTFSQRGGDTVVIEKLLEGLKNSNVEVVVDLEGKENPKDYNLVHIFNFAIPDMVKYYGERAKAAGVPFIVTTLLEDIPSFHYQSHYVASVIQEYITHGQSAEWWSDNKPDLSKVAPCKRFENDWSATNAAALLTNGSGESTTVYRDYGKNVKVKEVKLGYDLGRPGNADTFYKEFGVKDFVLCVGRIETRKNQLMLLKALENEDITVVFAGGGFSYQPEYLEAVQKFKRKGKTIFLPRLTDQQLADAYAAARVHALPSWYELPGLVSLEAAYYGCNIVATKRGTTYDYLGQDAFYCDPTDEDSIRSAVIAAYYAPIKKDLKEKVMAHSWEETANKTLEAYREVSGWQTSVPETTQPTQTKTIDLSLGSVDGAQAQKVQELLESGELKAKEGSFEEALKIFAEAESIEPASARLLRAHGAVLLASGDFNKAHNYFERAVTQDGFDGKSYCGLGMCEVMAGDREKGYNHFIKALEINPEHMVALLQLVESSYALNRFDALERALRRYLNQNSNDAEMEFCLAGCLYKLNRIDEAQAHNNNVKMSNANHEGARELQKILDALRSSQTNDIHSTVEVERGQSRSDLSSFSKEFNVIDQKLIELEEVKRTGKYEEVRTALGPIFSDPMLGAVQKETAQCLSAEIAVLTDDFEGSEKLYTEILERNAQCTRALCGRGAIAASKGDWNGAQRYFEDALAIRAEYDVALAGLGLCAGHNKSYEAAWGFYERAHRSNPENVRALFGLIEMGYVLKRLPPVENALKAYLDLHPADIDFMYSLAGCCFAQGKVDEAVEAINTITLFDPNHKHALELRMMIEKGERPSL